MPDSLLRSLTPREFCERLREQETREAEAAADALAPLLAHRPAMLRSALRGDSGLRPVVIYDGWDAPDESIVMARIMPNGSVAALVADALPGVRTAAQPSGAALGNADEAARVLGISEAALWKRKERGDLPPGSIVKTGRRVQFRIDKLLADPVKRRKRAR